MIAKYREGQKVRVLPLVGSDGRADRQVGRHVGKSGEVVKAYCVTRDEMPDLNKMFVYPDVYCYDVRLDDNGNILRGIPEAALEPQLFKRS
ncbi:MAG: hypothetical protein A2137_00290 [Chloroflexi bacterium RBG_16_58_8]|nr:MAG: hypothetical protein A2137_00290 [Chloroflexi bacterium RBG_16_58_8]